MLTCDVTHTAETSRRTGTPFTDDDVRTIDDCFAELEGRILLQFDAEGAAREEVTLERAVGMRFRRQVTTLDVHVERGAFTAEDGERLLDRFVARYAHVHGQGALLPGGGIDVERFRVVGTRPIEPVAFPPHEDAGTDADGALKGERAAHFEEVGFTTTRVYDGDLLRAGNAVSGPAVIERMGDTVVVPPEYTAVVDPYLSLRLSLSDPVAHATPARTEAEVV
jgi:N-methylhydantoinase A/oxoprolinase/acetone carboxylase beta subunit